jgi:carboxymethylenebutenolidase
MASEPISSQHIQLAASDGHTFDAYVAQTTKMPEAAIVIVQEIFGVNAHIRSVVDDYASEGFLAIAPALFDRVEPGVELNYDPQGQQRGIG